MQNKIFKNRVFVKILHLSIEFRIFMNFIKEKKKKEKRFNIKRKKNLLHEKFVI